MEATASSVVLLYYKNSDESRPASTEESLSAGQKTIDCVMPAPDCVSPGVPVSAAAGCDHWQKGAGDGVSCTQEVCSRQQAVTWTLAAEELVDNPELVETDIYSADLNFSGADTTTATVAATTAAQSQQHNSTTDSFEPLRSLLRRTLRYQRERAYNHVTPPAPPLPTSSSAPVCVVSSVATSPPNRATVSPVSSSATTPSLSLGATTTTGVGTPGVDGETEQSRLSRWFSLRKSISTSGSSGAVDTSCRPRSAINESEIPDDLILHPPLPPALPVLSTEHVSDSSRLKRRHVLQSIIHSENNYVASLQTLFYDYKTHLEASQSQILNSAKIHTIFYRIEDILHCHMLFRVALNHSLARWDAVECVGDTFLACFSKASVLNAYSDFINNFSVAMDTIRHEVKRKSSFAELLKQRQSSMPDRLSLFGLMVKPVQRFPQFILQLQDLLKYTPHDHCDRLNLQLALTQLESLAEMLNERKRESEQLKAFRKTLRKLSGKFSSRCLSDKDHYLLRECDAMRLDFGATGAITRSKAQRLFLLNDSVVCVNVTSSRGARDREEGGVGASAAAGAPTTAVTGACSVECSERLTYKWSAPLSDVEVLDSNVSLTLSNVLTASVCAGRGTAGALSAHRAGEGTSALASVAQLCQEMADLMHDYEVVARIATLVQSLRASYTSYLSTDTTTQLSAHIQRCIRDKDEEIAWLDACCLQLLVRRGSAREDRLTYQMSSPAQKLLWTTDFRLAQLALDANNSPAWSLLDRSSSLQACRVPLFVKCVQFAPNHQPPATPAGSEQSRDSGVRVSATCYYSHTAEDGQSSARRLFTLCVACEQPGACHSETGTATSTARLVCYALQSNHVTFREAGSCSLDCARVVCMQFVPALGASSAACVWVATSDARLLIFSANNELRHYEHSIALPCPPHCMQALHDSMFVGLDDCSLTIVDLLCFTPSSLSLCALANRPNGADSARASGSHQHSRCPITSLMAVGKLIYASFARSIAVIDAVTRRIQNCVSLEDHGSAEYGNITLMAYCGTCLWVAASHSTVICLYHAHTFRHVHDIDVAVDITRRAPSNHVTDIVDSTTLSSTPTFAVTSLQAAKGMLWIGTSLGHVLTLALPRLGGFPIVAARANVSLHAHTGPVRCIQVLQELNHYVNEMTGQPLLDCAVTRSSSLTNNSNNVVSSIPEEMCERSDCASDHQRATVVGDGDAVTECAEDDEEDDTIHVCDRCDDHVATTTVTKSPVSQSIASSIAQVSPSTLASLQFARPHLRRPRALRKRGAMTHANSAETRCRSRTLPRGFFGSLCANQRSDNEDVYDLYGALFCAGQDPDRLSSSSETRLSLSMSPSSSVTTITTRNGRSELSTVSQVPRPRSLELGSSWSLTVASNTSHVAANYLTSTISSLSSTTSGSSGYASCGGESHSAPASRNQSFRTPPPPSPLATEPHRCGGGGSGRRSSLHNSDQSAESGVQRAHSAQSGALSVVTLTIADGYTRTQPQSLHRSARAAHAHSSSARLPTNSAPHFIVWEMKL